MLIEWIVREMEGEAWVRRVVYTWIESSMDKIAKNVSLHYITFYAEHIVYLKGERCVLKHKNWVADSLTQWICMISVGYIDI